MVAAQTPLAAAKKLCGVRAQSWTLIQAASHRMPSLPFTSVSLTESFSLLCSRPVGSR